MKSVLLVVDVQNEFVAEPRLTPAAEVFLPRIAALLRAFRKQAIPVVHAHYVTEPDGRGRMPHHQANNLRRCERGTSGAAPHPLAEPVPGEPVFSKHALSAFSSQDFEAYIKKLGAKTVIICGLYSHACVRQTALDALERRLHVQIAEDAIASYDSLHAEVTRTFLTNRAVEYLASAAVIAHLTTAVSPSLPSVVPEMTYPVACIDGHWLPQTNEQVVELRNPSRWDQVLGYVPMAGLEILESAVSATVQAQHAWKSRPLEERLSMVDIWADLLESRMDQFLPHMIDEAGKPISACRIELGLLRQSLRVMRKAFTDEARERVCLETPGQAAIARRCPRGVVTIIAPWNNPVFLPACKIAAAIALGNGVVWKPAMPCPRTSAAVQDSLLDAGLPPGLVNLVYGGATTAQHLIALPGVNAVTLTGSVDTGRQVAAACGSMLKPLQAELGGNNAAIVTENCNLAKVAGEIALAAFGFAGQACTATRRIVVLASVEEQFVALLKKSTQALAIGDPHQETTIVGPVISRAHQLRIEHMVTDAGDTAKVFEVVLPEKLKNDGCWLPPRIIQGLEESSPLVQQETFAPILVVQTATDLQDAIRLSNAVPHGLIGSIYCDDKNVLKTFRDNVQTGIVQLNRPTRALLMEAPFCGWKHSGLGPPEHGIWDLDFYTQWQAVYENRS